MRVIFIRRSRMENQFAQAFVPEPLRNDFLMLCTNSPHDSCVTKVWMSCLQIVLSMASQSQLRSHFSTANLLRACDESLGTLGLQLRPDNLGNAHRNLGVGVLSKIFAWHSECNPLVDWAMQVLLEFALLPVQKRLPVALASALCERTVKSLGYNCTEAKADEVGNILLRVIGLGAKGRITVRQLWTKRDTMLVRVFSYRNWTVLAGVAKIGSTGASGKAGKVLMPVDAHMWTSAARALPKSQCQVVLERLLFQFRVGVEASAAKGDLLCTCETCLAMTTLNAFVKHRQGGLNSVLMSGMQLFCDGAHAVSGCRHSAYRSYMIGGGGHYLLPSWGGEGSSLAAAAALNCLAMNTRRTARGLRLRPELNPTDSVLCTVVPKLAENIGSVRLDGRDLVNGTIHIHTRQAIAVLAASPFCDSEHRRAEWRRKLLRSLRGKTDFWRDCVSRIGTCSSRTVSRLFAWKGASVMHNLLEAASAARGFVPHAMADSNSTLVNPVYTAEESVRMWALTRVLQIFSATRRVGISIAVLHNAVTHNLGMSLNPVKTQLAIREVSFAFEQALGHPEFGRLMLAGGFKGSWACSCGNEAFHGSKELVGWVEMIGGPLSAALMRREAGLWTVKPGDYSNGWWHLGLGFREAALYFLWASRLKFGMPPELGMIVLSTAASLH